MHLEGFALVIKMLTCFDSVRIFYIFSVVVQSYVKRGFWLSNELYFTEQAFFTEQTCVCVCVCGVMYVYGWYVCVIADADIFLYFCESM